VALGRCSEGDREVRLALALAMRGGAPAIPLWLKGKISDSASRRIEPLPERLSGLRPRNGSASRLHLGGDLRESLRGISEDFWSRLAEVDVPVEVGARGRSERFSEPKIPKSDIYFVFFCKVLR